jgi:hypothetical protein
MLIHWNNFFPRVYRLDRPCGGSSRNLSNSFFVAYIGWTSHGEAVGEISGASFLSRIQAGQAMWRQ